MSTLATTRARRENAGNRMQALLAGQYVLQEEEVFEEVVGDDEFEAAADEADVFASDFASTDDEADVQAADDADRTLQREEAAAEREARARRFHDPLAQAKRKPAPTTTATATASSTNAEKNKRRRVAYVETEDAFPGLWEEPPERMRAVRTSTIAQKAEVDTRLKKAMATKRPPPPPKQHLKLSQSDLIDLALELETTNRRELEDWLEKEEERRRSVMVRRSVVKGERVTWISRTVTVEPNTRPTTTEAQARALTPTVPPPQQQQTTTRYERNLLNLFQIERGKELDVIFGDHADWKAVPVLPNKRAQLNRQSTKCPITGLPARYKCPRTGIPYANLAAYRTIKRILDTDKGGDHGYRWSAERGTWLSGGYADDPRGRGAVAEDDDLDEEGRAADVPGWREVMGIRVR